eukprot:GILI01003150.1.p1 GENE.GILI01003150.1~~GILI01003150.1.p1  ORF type:complete len:343 (+),score=61.02 GILI01003150.1:34-1062(+)
MALRSLQVLVWAALVLSVNAIGPISRETVAANSLLTAKDVDDEACWIIVHGGMNCPGMSTLTMCENNLVEAIQIQTEMAANNPLNPSDLDMHHPCRWIHRKFSAGGSEDWVEFGRLDTLKNCYPKCFALWRATQRGCTCQNIKETPIKVTLDQEFVEKALATRHNLVLLQGEQTRGRFIDHMQNLREENSRFLQVFRLLNNYFGSKLQDPTQIDLPVARFLQILYQVEEDARWIEQGLRAVEEKFQDLDKHARVARSVFTKFFDGFDFRMDLGDVDYKDERDVVWDNDQWMLRVAEENVNGLPTPHTFETAGRERSGANYFPTNQDPFKENSAPPIPNNPKP